MPTWVAGTDLEKLQSLVLNIRYRSDAANIVMNSNISLVMVGLDVTLKLNVINDIIETMKICPNIHKRGHNEQRRR